MSKLNALQDILTSWTKADDAARIEGVKRLGLPDNNTAADRAKAMGFGDTQYHGTNKDFNSFDPNTKTRVSQFTGNSDNGRGAIYMGDNPEAVNRYSASVLNGDDVKYKFNTDNPVDTIDNVKVTYENGRVMPIQTRGNIFDGRNPEHISKIDNLLQGKAKEGYWGDMESSAMQDNIKNAGFDGYKVTTGDSAVGNAIFNPANIRSKFAHFNPKMAGVGAGSILSADLMADELDLEHKPKVSTWDSLMNTIGGVNQQQAQAYGDTGAGAMNLAGDIVTEPDVAAELAIRGLSGIGLGGLLMSNEVGAAEKPDFFQQLQNKRVR